MPSINWYPQNPKELNEILEKFLNQKQEIKVSQEDIHGIIVPHAGYEYSGAVAGKAFSLLKNPKFKRVIILGPSHYVSLKGISSTEENLSQEHSINNQIPFLQKLGFKEIKKIMVGQLNLEQAKEIAEKLSKEKGIIFVFSTDLSHFNQYDKAVNIDKNTIKIIENLDLKKSEQIDACGIYPLLILIQLCKLKGWKPKLVEYKNSGDIKGDKSSVVGYSSMIF